MLKVENVKKAFGAVTVLDGVDLTVKPGEVVSILGSSGSGKSTLIRCINGLEKLDGGRITVDDFDVSNPRDLSEARKRSGTVFQLFNLYPHMTALQNITLAPVEVLKKPRAEAEEKARALLASVGLGERADAYPAQLSGGQRQRVGICRALIQHPELLLVDEPTASLDPKTSRQIMRLIKELCEERKLSAIINIHDVMLAQMFAERIVGLKAGEIVYDGSPAGLTAEVLTKIYGEEDWSATIRPVDEDADQGEAGNVIALDTHMPRRDRLAGLT